MNGDGDQRQRRDDARQRTGDIDAPFQHPEDAVRIANTQPRDGDHARRRQKRAAHAEHQRLAQGMPEIGTHPVLHSAEPNPATQDN